MSGVRPPARCRHLVGVGTVAVLALTGCTDHTTRQGDVLSAPMPAGMATMADQVPAVIELVRHREWAAADAAVQRVESAWTTVHDWDQRPRVGRVLHRLAVAVDRHDVRRATRSALDAQQLTLALEVGYRPAPEVDTERFRLGTSRLELDVEARDLAAVRDDVAALSRLRGKIGGAVPAERLARVDEALADLQEALLDRDLARIGAAGQQLATGW